MLIPVLALLAGVPIRAQDKAKPPPTDHPFLWRIEGEAPSWLFGTFHLPDPRVTALHPAVAQAIESCDALFTELTEDAGEAAKGMQQAMLPKGKKLGDVLPADVLRSLEALLAARNLSLTSPMDHMKPWAVTFQVLAIDHAKDFLGTPLDTLVHQLAKDANKEVGGIETMAEQLMALEAISDADQAALLADMIAQVESRRREGRDLVDEMVRAYVAGTEQGLDSGFWPVDPALAARMRKTMVIDRNVVMADRIVAKMLAEPKRRFFFAVGALHLVHEQGVVALLRKRGFVVTRLPETVADIDEELRVLEAQAKALHERIEHLRRRREQLKKPG